MPVKNNAIFIAATGQNVGKTTLCLGILAALKKRFSSVGFIKPIGQHHVTVKEEIDVDKDAILFKEHFQLPSNWSHMSPVILASGFTRRFLDNELTEEILLKQIHNAFHYIQLKNSYTVVEGTGHIGVGSIINLNNARVAAELGLNMVIIASAGLGSSFDELSLNIAMCKQYGVNIKGIILNRIIDSKKEMIASYFPRLLERWNIPLIGSVPFTDMLSKPTMKDFELLFDTCLLSGHQHYYRTFSHTRLVAGSLEAYEAEAAYNELVITPASRSDIILKKLEKHRQAALEGRDLEGGLILTSQRAPSALVVEQICRSEVPVIYAPLCSYDAMKKITSFTTKIRAQDTAKIEKAIQLVEQYVNIDAICN